MLDSHIGHVAVKTWPWKDGPLSESTCEGTRRQPKTKFGNYTLGRNRRQHFARMTDRMGSGWLAGGTLLYFCANIFVHIREPNVIAYPSICSGLSSMTLMG